jgi:kynurenine formamidase
MTSPAAIRGASKWPLVVVAIRAAASIKADARLTPDDLKAWEQKHGPMPAGAVVPLFSGWESRVNDARKFFGLDDKGGYHFPGFHVEAVEFLQEHRQVKGIAIDTLSLDSGINADFPVHHYCSTRINGSWKTWPGWASFRRKAQPSSWARR